MKFAITIILLILISFNTLKGQVHYVSTTGGSGSGTLSDPWSLTHACSVANAGDTVWVKAGNYMVGNLTFQNSGTAIARIVFIGYRDIPGDIDSTNIPTNVQTYLTGNYGGNTAKFPTINGLNRSTAGLGIQLYERHYITLRNFHITNYNYGIGTWNSSYINLENIVCAYIGDIYHLGGYNGVGISISNTSYCNVRNCFVYNSSAEGFSIVSSEVAPTKYNVVNHCYVFCDDTTKTGLPGGVTAASTDYYFVLGSTNNFDAEYNEISDCYIERIGDVGHGGHGFAIVNYDYDSNNNQGKTRYNTIKNCTSKSIRSLFHLRGKDTEYNTFINCKGIAGGNEPGNISITCSKYNLFDKIEIDIPIDSINNYYFHYPVIFYKTVTYSPGYQFSGVGNVFTNCMFKTPGGIGFGYYNNGTENYSADSNRFVNCNFINKDINTTSSFVLAQRLNQGNKFENCIITGYQNYIATQSSQNTSLNFENCCISGNGFNQNNMSNATFINCIYQNPQFINPINSDFHLQSTSPCIDSGKIVSIIDDFENNHRPCNNFYDIGAFEFQDNCTSNVINESQLAINIYPNPAYHSINIEGLIAQSFTIELFSATGNSVKRVANQKTINISNLSNGLYFMKIAYDNKYVIHKFIKL